MLVHVNLKYHKAHECEVRQHHVYSRTSGVDHVHVLYKQETQNSLHIVAVDKANHKTAKVSSWRDEEEW